MIIKEIEIQFKLSEELSNQLFDDPKFFSKFFDKILGLADALKVDEVSFVDSNEQRILSSVSSK